MTALDRMSDTRRQILTGVKRRGTLTASEVAGMLQISGEAARSQLKLLDRDGLIEARPDRDSVGTAGGRPALRYALTDRGEHLFAKRYDDLAVLLIDSVGDRLGPDALRAVLAEAADAKVASWAHRMQGLDVAERLHLLRDIYLPDDPWVEVSHDDQGWLLVERNCPFLDVAMRRPALCSITVHALSRLVGRKVVRVARFQDGDRLCAFRITDDPVRTDGFALESDG